MKQTPLNHLKSLQKPSTLQIIVYIFLVTFALNFVLWILSLLLNIPSIDSIRGFLSFVIAIVLVMKWVKKRNGNSTDQSGAVGAGPQYKSRPQGQQSQSLDLVLNQTTSIENPYSGIFICGGAGSGKSKSIIEPIIYDAGRKDFTGVVYDFKFPELARHIETAYKNSAVKRYYVNFSDLSTSNCINPLAPEIMRNASFAREFATSVLQNINPQSISKPDFWSDNSQILLSAIFWYLREEHPEMCTLPHAISLAVQPNYEALIRLLQTNDQCADMVAPIASALETGANQQLGAVISSLQVSLNKINTPEIYYITGQGNDFSLNINDIENPAILTIGNDPVLASTYGPVIGLILTSITKQLNQQGKAKSMILIDEFPTVFVPNIQTIPATGRSNKIATILACQDITQVVDMYGKSKADTILSNLGNQFYGRTTNPETAKRVVQMFGKEDRLMASDNVSYAKKLFWHEKTGRSESYSYQEREVVKVQEVATLPTGSFYAILSESENRMSKISIPLDKSFRHSDLPEISNVTEEDVKRVYTRIKKDIQDLISGVSSVA